MLLIFVYLTTVNFIWQAMFSKKKARTKKFSHVQWDFYFKKFLGSPAKKNCTFMSEERRSAAFTVVNLWCMYTSESKRSSNNTVSGWIYDEALQNRWSQILFMLIQLFSLFQNLLSPVTSDWTACCLDSSTKISQSISEKRLYQVLLQINIY